MNVFAAASLTVAFPKFDGGQKYNFAGTDALAAQIRLGAPADLFAGASPDAPQALYRAGLVEQPVTFATNKLVLAVPIANPAEHHEHLRRRAPRRQAPHRHGNRADRRLHASGARATWASPPRSLPQRREPGAERQRDLLQGRARHRRRRLHVRDRRARGLRQGQAHPGPGLGAAARSATRSRSSRNRPTTPTPRRSSSG